jgi:hypothetical protein
MGDRITVLARAVAAEPGPWTTARVQRLWRDRGVDAPLRHTARQALDQLARRGRLVCDDSDPDRRTYYRPEADR